MGTFQRDNEFILNCSPNSANLIEVLHCVNLSKDFNKLGYAKITISPEHFPVVTETHLKQHLLSFNNKHHPSFQPLFGKYVPSKIKLDLTRESELTAEFGPLAMSMLKKNLETCQSPIQIHSIHEKAKNKNRAGLEDRLEAISVLKISKSANDKYAIESGSHHDTHNPIDTFGETFCNISQKVSYSDFVGGTGYEYFNYSSFHDETLQLDKYAALGNKITEMLSQRPDVYSLEQVREKFPGCGEPTQLLLKLLDLIRRNTYHYYYINADVPMRLDLGNGPETILDEDALSRYAEILLNSQHAKVQKKFNGITSTWTYYGYPLSIFPLHTEEVLSINSLNVMVSGEKKLWIVIGSAYKATLDHKLKRLVELVYFEGLSPSENGSLGENMMHRNLFHKNLFLQPDLLELLDIPYTVVEQSPGDLIVTGEGVYHQGINCGLNYSAAVNINLQQYLQELCVYSITILSPTEYRPRLLNLSLDDIKVNMAKILNLDEITAEKTLNGIHRYSSHMCDCTDNNCRHLRSTAEAVIKNIYTLANIQWGKNTVAPRISHVEPIFHMLVQILDDPIPIEKSRLDFLLWISLVFENFCFQKYSKDADTRVLKGKNDAVELEPRKIPILAMEGSRMLFFQSLEKLQNFMTTGDSCALFEVTEAEIVHIRKEDADGFVCLTCANKYEKLQKGCRGTFPSLRKLRAHFEVYNKQYVCNEVGPCNRREFCNKEGVVTHIQTKHRVWKIWCPYCRKCFSVFKGFKQHTGTCIVNLLCKEPGVPRRKHYFAEDALSRIFSCQQDEQLGDRESQADAYPTESRQKENIGHTDDESSQPLLGSHDSAEPYSKSLPTTQLQEMEIENDSDYSDNTKTCDQPGKEGVLQRKLPANYLGVASKSIKIKKQRQTILSQGLKLAEIRKKIETTKSRLSKRPKSLNLLNEYVKLIDEIYNISDSKNEFQN